MEQEKEGIEKVISVCCVCHKAETEPEEDSKYSHTYLSRKCYKEHYKDEPSMLAREKKLKFRHETCDGLYETKSH